VTPSARAAVFGVPALLCAGWTVYAGKDLNWDLLHYHYYVAYALLDGRFGQDYFAAGTESYLNPLGYVPFYLMVSAGWHSVLVSMLLAAVHSASIALLYLIAWRLFSHRPPGSRAVLSALAAALGAASAVFWTTAGTSFLDPLLAVPMLAGVWLLLGAEPPKVMSRAAWAGVLFGLAAALKYSNAFYALAALALVASIPATSWRVRTRTLIAYCAGGAASVGVFAGPWLVFLAREFGNPLFPHFNAWFRSPEAPLAMLSAGRFAPRDLSEALAFPFRLASPESMTYAEISAPDLRFAALVLAAVALLALTLMRRGTSALASSHTQAARLLGFFALCLVAWMWTSANARYGLLVLLLVGPCLAWIAERLLARHALVALPLLIAAQLAACAMISPTRWFVAERWSSNWFGVVAPERALKEPALYVSIEPQAMAASIPFLHPAASFASLQGQDGAAPRWQRLATMRAASGERLRVRGRGLRLQADGRPRPEVVETYNATLIRFGYRLDTADCFAIAWRLEDQDALSRWANALSAQRESRDRTMSLASCGLLPAQRDPREIEEERRMSVLFDRVERSCPRVFQGLTAVTERLGTEWMRSYAALDARMETQSGRLLLVPWFKLRYVDLGRLADWDGGARPRLLACE
jgi:hypothetical protein